MVKVVVLGAGNVGTHLCVALQKNNEVLLLQNYNRKGNSIKNCEVPVTNKKSKIAIADIYIFTLSDNSLHVVNKEFNFLKGIIVHTSGSTPLQVFKGFENYGVFYPLYSFTKEIPVDFKKVPIAIEASNKQTESLLLKVAKSISKQVYVLNSEQRNGLHVAAVFANNFSNFMYTQSASICADFGVDFEIMKPIISESIKKLKQSAPKELQTGPAIRKDSSTITRHLNTIKNKDQIKLYELLTQAIQKHYEQEL